MDKPRPQEIYRHFKGNLYQIITLAKDTESGETMVVYQALYGDFSVFSRPLEMFLSPVDRKKYPNAAQERRFERVDPVKTRKRLDTQTPPVQVPEEVTRAAGRSFKGGAGRVVVPQAGYQTIGTQEARPQTAVRKPSSVMQKSLEEEAEALHMHPLLIAFLDARSTTKRLKLLDELRPNITNEMIDIMAMAIDTEINPGDPDVRYDELRDILLTRERFESNRLRSSDIS